MRVATIAHVIHTIDNVNVPALPETRRAPPVTCSRRDFLLRCAAGACAGTRAAAASPSRRANRIPVRGVVPAALTPFAADLRVDRDEFRRHLHAMAAVHGVTAIMVNGAAGQDTALTRDERRQLLADALAAVGDRTPILAAVRESREHDIAAFAQDAAAEGAHALAVMPPGNKEQTEWEGARTRFSRVIDAASLPVAIYHTNYSTETLTRLAALEPVFAIKEGSGDPATFERNLRSVRALGRNVAVWSTNSRWLLADLAVGADGILSGMGSTTADLHVALAEAVWRSDLDAARRVNDRLFPLTQVFYGPGANAHTRMKHALVRLGRWKNAVVRPPLKPLDDAERAAIDRALVAAGLLPK